MKASVRLVRLLTPMALAGLGLLLCATPVFAIAAPDSLQVNSVYAYRHCIETDDQLYLVEYSITYPAESNPDENVTEAYLGRLMNGTTELGAVAPYAYYDEGYGTGIFAIYFSASEVTEKGMIWNGSYSMHLVGNPTLSWTPSIPSTSVSTFDLWSSSTSIDTTQGELASRVLYLADQLELDWGVNMVDTTGTGSYLADYGEAYFTNAIPNILAMAPGAFAGGTTAPEWDAKEPVTDYAEDRASSVEGTPLDVGEAADIFGISRMWASSILFILGGIVLLYAAMKPTGSFRGLVFLSIPLVVAGGYLGLIPMLFTVLAGVGAFALTAFLLFYHPSSV